MIAPTSFFLPEQIAPALDARLRTLLADVGARLAVNPQGCKGAIVPLEAVELVQRVPVVAIYDGALGRQVLPALEREPPALLLACAEDGAPRKAELQALLALLEGRPLIGAMGKVLGRARVTHFEGIQAAARAAGELAASMGAGSLAVAAAADSMYELVANAILDAPVGPDGEPRYAHRRDTMPDIAPEDACEIAVGATEDWVLVSATDRFGRLTKGPFVEAVRGLEGKARINDSGGGAGLGIRRVLELGELTVVRVNPGRATQVLSAVSRTRGRRRAQVKRSLFFWVEKR